MDRMAAEYTKSACREHGERRPDPFKVPKWVIAGERNMIHVANGAYLFVKNNKELKLHKDIDIRMFAFKKEDDPWNAFYGKECMEQ